VSAASCGEAVSVSSSLDQAVPLARALALPAYLDAQPKMADDAEALLAKADPAWLAQLVTRCETPEDFMRALQRVPDAYGALRLLAAHPRIDPRRIALMGFSHGGALTMLASTAWAKDTYAAGGLPSFRAFFPFYPNCNPSFPERSRVSAPVRIHTGAADDWTPAKP